MRLADFIHANIEPILQDWETFARSLLPGATMTVEALRDDAEDILRATVRDMQNPQSLAEQASKSKGTGGAGGADSDRLDDASEAHGKDRVGSGFHICDVVAEYRALRASVLRLWRESLPQPDLNDINDLTRFNESLDQSIARAVASYTKRIEESRNIFLGILSHDLRDPLTCIRMAAKGVSVKNKDPFTTEMMEMIETTTKSMSKLIIDLIEYSSSRLGRTLLLKREPVDLNELAAEVVAEFRTAHPERTIKFHSEGKVQGVWDSARLKQVLSNLIANAVQYGAPEKDIALSIAPEASQSDVSKPEEAPAAESMIVIQVNDQGPPIPAEVLPTIFNPLVRHATYESALKRNSSSIGLGLYIVREFVTAEGGTVEVTSTEAEGTTFTVRLPRFPKT